MAGSQIMHALGQIAEARTADDVASVLMRLSGKVGLRHIALLKYACAGCRDGCSVIGNDWPGSWIERFKRPRNAGMDPVLRYLQIAQQPFLWRDALASFASDPQFEAMEGVMAEAAAHGLEDGCVFPIHGKGGLLSFAVMAGDKVDLPASEILILDAVFRAAYWQVLKIEDQRQRAERDARAKLDITPREREVLMHLAEGLTSIEIGEILAISRHTVDWYMGGLQAKFGARNRAHALAIAFRNGTIS